MKRPRVLRLVPGCWFLVCPCGHATSKFTWRAVVDALTAHHGLCPGTEIP